MAEHRYHVTEQDIHLAKVATAHGAHFALRIIIECRVHELPISLGFALFEHESGFSNVFGHDPTIFVGTGLVTRAKYLAYRARRRLSGNKLMQGVGPGQLTYWSTQDLADKLGGCWKPAVNIRVAVMTLAARIKERGYAEGIKAYNGGGPAAVIYSRQVRAGARRWHAILS